MKTLLKLLFRLDLINLSKLEGLIYLEIEPNQAGAKIVNMGENCYMKFLGN